MARALPAIGSRALVARAEQKLFQREQAAVQADDGLLAKKERVSIVLKSAMEIVLEDSSDESIAELERALEAAQQVGVLPQVRVQARKILAQEQAKRKRYQDLEEQLHKMLKLAEAAHLEFMEQNANSDRLQSKTNSSSSSPTGSISSEQVSGAARMRLLNAVKRKAEMTLHQLRQAVAAAQGHKLTSDLLGQAIRVIQSIEQDQTHEDVHEHKLKQLLDLKDPEKIKAQLQLARRRDEARGPKSQKIVSELQARVTKLTQREQHQQWLDAEIEAAIAHRDAYRLRQLTNQGRALELTVLPATTKLLHQLEQEQFEREVLGQPAASSSSSALVPTEALADSYAQRKRGSVNERLDVFVQRKKEAVEKVLDFVAYDPTLRKFEEAKQVISEAKATKVPPSIITEMEKRLTDLEDKFGPRLHAEENLLQILRTSELVSYDMTEDEEEDGPVLHDMAKIAVLRKAVNDARKMGVVEDLLDAGETLLFRSCTFEFQQREAAENLRQMLNNQQLSDDKQLEELHLAIDAASRCGLATLHAERELLRLREVQVNREAAEAELREARKGQGAQGKARLEAAIQAAKSAGVEASKLQAANSRMQELKEHYKKCSLVAGNIRRKLQTLEQEPWKFQQIVASAQSLQPWTTELDKLVRTATAQLDKCIKGQAQQREVEAELQALLARISEGRASGQTCADDTVQLAQVMVKAKEAKVRKEIFEEGEQQLKGLRREGCQRTVAEHRLRLALNAKDFGEIERSIREVRALEGLTAGNHSARGDQVHQPQSARLMDSANSMLRHLGDMSTRRQAAEHALMLRINDNEDNALHMHAAVDGQANSDDAHQGTEQWVRELMEIVHEAKQCGVAPSLIEHAKLKIRQKRREIREEEEAALALKKTLGKKDVSPQELLRSIRKVQRFHSKPSTSRTEDATTRP